MSRKLFMESNDTFTRIVRRLMVKEAEQGNKERVKSLRIVYENMLTDPLDVARFPEQTYDLLLRRIIASLKILEYDIGELLIEDDADREKCAVASCNSLAFKTVDNLCDRHKAV